MKKKILIFVILKLKELVEFLLLLSLCAIAIFVLSAAFFIVLTNVSGLLAILGFAWPFVTDYYCASMLFIIACLCVCMLVRGSIKLVIDNWNKSQRIIDGEETIRWFE